jgi:gliding motility-associated-like protein
VHTWTFGDGGSTNNFAPGVHHYGTWGTFDVTLDVDNGYCDDAVTQTVTIHPPAPQVAFSGEAEGCAPVDVAFTNESEYAASVIWDFGDGATSTEFDPVHQYQQPGVYDVTLRITGHQGLVQEVTHTAVVTVLPSPTALFEFAPYEVVAPAEEVAFINLSSNDATEYLWNFGNGETSNEEHPRYSYDAPGLYSISLAVRNEFGCTDTHTYVDAITAKAGGFMIFPTAFTPDLTGPNGGGYNLSDLDNDVFHPHHAGVQKYELSIFNIWGEMIFNSTDPMVGWDGYVNGLLAPQNTYVWKASARFSDGRRLIQSGDFTLIIN